MTPKTLFAVLLLSLSSLTFAGPLQDIFPRVCEPGVYDQPDGDFALYVFCDDAAGTNVAAFVKDYGRYVRPPYREAERFWQDASWGTDVLGFFWVPNRNELLIKTSPIYGTGTLYLLELESQTSKALYESSDEFCVTNINVGVNAVDSFEVSDCSEAGETLVIQ
ncbi:hypothetical protein BGP77_12080 [Saccharospirillum sp. MSK14-1]|uniref:hypothetical protein n=1 Tax=Saccharospirillum sp. MSK14-1 TaxID=1897632 RepID=UPI000D3BDB30|nr:hypothetical protein [Saccharospirillum sp. MSK14-1]PTY38443.1 hypothetical protein BGP77_12080 [Saccharospirillum sp. MSK14-1]